MIVDLINLQNYVGRIIDEYGEKGLNQEFGEIWAWLNLIISDAVRGEEE
jgi:hypothetical protein